MVKLNWTKGLGKGVSYYIASINKDKYNMFISDFIIYKVVLDINIFNILLKLKVLSKDY